MRDLWKQGGCRHLKLILLGSGILCLVLSAFGFYDDRREEAPLSITPPVWAFEAKNRTVPEGFQTDGTMQTETSRVASSLPAMDRVAPKQTEFALFALG